MTSGPVGVSYHLWAQPDRWEHDLAAMAELGLDLVRADWAWREIERLPFWRRTGEVVRFLDLADRVGLRVILLHTAARSDTNTPRWFRAISRRWRMVAADGAELAGDWPSFHHAGWFQSLGNCLESVARSLAGHPAIFAHQPMNEPHQPQWPITDYRPRALARYRLQTGDRPPRTPPVPDAPDWPRWIRWRRWQAEQLADRVEQLANRLRRGDPKTPVLVAEMPWWWWGEQAATAVAPDLVYRGTDLVGIDCYPENAADAAYLSLTIDHLRRIWNRPIWLSEVNRKDGDPTSDDLCAFAEAGARAGAAAYLHFQWRDDDRDGGRYGLYDGAGAARPSLAAFREAITVWRSTIPDWNAEHSLTWPAESAWAHGDACTAPAELYRTAKAKLESGLTVGVGL